MITNLIKYCYEQGWSGAIYTGGAIAAMVFQLVFLMLYKKKYGFSWKQFLVLFAISTPLQYFSMFFLAWVENGFRNWGANNIVRAFVYFPLFFALAAKVVGVSAKKVIDFAAPSQALNQAIGHLVCPFAGCCQGYACSWGIWNPVSNERLFPNQWLECLVALAVGLYLFYLAKKENYAGTGRIYAMFLVLFGGTRFLLEFLRDNDKIFVGISNLAFHALFMALVGAIWLMVLYERDKKQKFKQKHKKYHHPKRDGV